MRLDPGLWVELGDRAYLGLIGWQIEDEAITPVVAPLYYYQ